MSVVNCVRLSVVLGLSALALIVSGCSGPAAAKNEVFGKVMLDGKAVAGNVVYVNGAGKEFFALIKQDGTYSTDLSPGDYKVAVRGMPGLGGSTAPPMEMPGGAKMPEMPSAGGPKGVAPPANYASVETSGLTFKHPGGKTENNIELKNPA